MMRDEISIEIMLGHPPSKQTKIQMDPPVDSPTATLSCFSDCDMKEDEDQNVEHENLVSHVPQTELLATNNSASFDCDNSIMDRSKHEMENWKRERQELLKLRTVVMKQQEKQQELQSKLEVYQRQHLGANGTESRDPNGHHVHSLSTRIDEIVRRNLNCFPDDEIACQLEEVQLKLTASQKQVHDLQDELIESRTHNEKSNKENLRTQETLQDQLRAAQAQLETERQKREDAMNVHKLQVELQEMRAKEDQEELNLKIDFWKDQFENVRKQLYGEDAPVPLETVKEELHEQAQEGDSANGEQGNDASQKVEGMPCQFLQAVPEEQQSEANSDPFERGIDNDMKRECKIPTQEDEIQRSETQDENNDSIESVRNELSEMKTKYQESAEHLTNLESVIHEMSGNQHTMVQKIHGVVRLLQDTQRENEKLKKEKATLLQKTKRENEKLKKEKLSLEKQRKEKLTMMTRNARR